MQLVVLCIVVLGTVLLEMKACITVFRCRAISRSETEWRMPLANPLILSLSVDTVGRLISWALFLEQEGWFG